MCGVCGVLVCVMRTGSDLFVMVSFVRAMERRARALAGDQSALRALGSGRGRGRARRRTRRGSVGGRSDANRACFVFWLEFSSVILFSRRPPRAGGPARRAARRMWDERSETAVVRYSIEDDIFDFATAVLRDRHRHRPAPPRHGAGRAHSPTDNMPPHARGSRYLLSRSLTYLSTLDVWSVRTSRTCRALTTYIITQPVHTAERRPLKGGCTWTTSSSPPPQKLSLASPSPWRCAKLPTLTPATARRRPKALLNQAGMQNSTCTVSIGVRRGVNCDLLG